MGSLRRDYSGVVGLIRISVVSLVWVHSGALKGRRIHSGLRGYTSANLGVIRFIRGPVDLLPRLAVVAFILVRVGSFRRSEVSSGSFGFAWIHSGAPSGRRAHSRSRG